MPMDTFTGQKSPLSCLEGGLMIETDIPRLVAHCQNTGKNPKTVKDETMYAVDLALRTLKSFDSTPGWLKFDAIILELRFTISLSTQVVRDYTRTSPESSLRGMQIDNGGYPVFVDEGYFLSRIQAYCKAAIEEYFEHWDKHLRAELRRSPTKILPHAPDGRSFQILDTEGMVGGVLDEGGEGEEYRFASLAEARMYRAEHGLDERRFRIFHWVGNSEEGSDMVEELPENKE